MSLQHVAGIFAESAMSDLSDLTSVWLDQNQCVQLILNMGILYYVLYDIQNCCYGHNMAETDICVVTADRATNELCVCHQVTCRNVAAHERQFEVN